ncbi:MAG: F0F1 ATP synthase subunit alpha [Spirochaetaceae bacterium]|jgi:F-type H+-transporting ATPase subunit alpha|nr:F0F1 ATP synthase subunit alpha [Spirochaetaceae bacterium]
MNFCDLTKVLTAEIEEWEGKPLAGTIGFVAQVGDSVATVHGLAKSLYGELVEFASGATGIILNLKEDAAGCVLLGGESLVRDGEEVRGTGRVASVPVGEALLGRVVGPLGQPLDGKGNIESGISYPVESPAPPVIERSSVDTPLQTGVLAVDSMIPIGRGQRELIIGDRQTGKTAIALDTIINQKGSDVLCVYCAIGQKTSSVAAIVENLKKYGAMDYTIVVLASAADSAALQYLAPYSAVAMAEYFMHKGKDVLVVYDDLSKHAVAYRTISLLLRRPPGREAFPGDVFYLHSRLLERAAKLSPEKGGGSITALPIIETQAGDISSYIPTNVISITDGQIFLDSELFNSGMRPAIDVGLSVSRVGGAAQAKAVRKVAGRLRLDLAQYREMAAFAQFGSDLDKATQDKLSQGSRLMEALKQKQFAPYAMEEQAALLHIAVQGMLVKCPIEKIGEFAGGLIEHLKTREVEILKDIAEKKEISAQTARRLEEAASKFSASLLKTPA